MFEILNDMSGNHIQVGRVHRNLGTARSMWYLPSKSGILCLKYIINGFSSPLGFWGDLLNLRHHRRSGVNCVMYLDWFV